MQVVVKMTGFVTGFQRIAVARQIL